MNSGRTGNIKTNNEVIVNSVVIRTTASRSKCIHLVGALAGCITVNRPDGPVFQFLVVSDSLRALPDVRGLRNNRELAYTPVTRGRGIEVSGTPSGAMFGKGLFVDCLGQTCHCKIQENILSVEVECQTDRQHWKIQLFEQPERDVAGELAEVGIMRE